MSRWFSIGTGESARAALGRWRERGLVEPELARRLERDLQAEEERSRGRFGQLVVAVTGATLLLIAVGVFLADAWPSLSAAARTVTIAFLGVLVHSAGSLLLRREHWFGLARVLEAAGLATLLSAFVYSGEAWSDGSASAVVVGVGALLVPVGLLPRAIRTDVAAASVVAALGYGFVAVFLDRALALGQEPLLWTLDGVAVLTLLFLLARLARAGDQEGVDWELAVLLVSLYAGLVLILFTGSEALDLEHDAVWALDAWLVLIAGATLWGIHGAPDRLRRAWYPRNLAMTMLLAIPLGFWSFEGSPAWITGSGMGALGALGLAYAVRTDARHLTLASCLTLIVAAWYLGVEMGEALGVAGALAFTAGLLFWISSRVGAGEAKP